MPKVKFTREDILKATYDIMKQEGIKNISARKIANKFKGFTAPIYANFKTIDELKDEIISMAEDRFKSYLYRNYVGREIFDAALGFIQFARDEKELFRAMFLDAADGFKELYDETMDFLLQEKILMKSFPELTYEQAKESLERLWTYLFGYATLVFINPNSKEETDNKIVENLEDISSYFKEVYKLQ